MAQQTEKQLDQTAHKGPESGHETARQNLAQEALTLYQCKDGSLAKNPRECTGTINELPNFTVG